MQKRHSDKLRYFDELAHTTRKYALPHIVSTCKITPKSSVLEIGCGIGGNLMPLVETGCRVRGIDLNPNSIARAKEIFKERGYEHVQLDSSNIFDVEQPTEKYDLVIARDVIEHIGNKQQFMKHLKRFVSDRGYIYISFPAWQMPFGGHQQICHSKILSHIPFLHLLPRSVYRWLLNAFGEQKAIVDELIDLTTGGMTIEHFRQLTTEADFEILDELFYFINPHYEVKFGLRPRRLYSFIEKIPYIRNFFTTSAVYILRVK